MLDIGFSELLLIAVAALVVVGPKDFPVVIRYVARWMRTLRGLYASMRKQVVQWVDDTGMDDLKREVTTIIDMDGKPQVAYDVKGLDGLKEKQKAAENDA